MVLPETTNQVINPLMSLWENVLTQVPGFIAAIIILIVGYIIALIVGKLIKIMIEKLSVDKAFKEIELPKSLKKLKVSSVIGGLTKWYIFIIFFQAAVDTINLGTLSIFLDRIVIWLPNLIIAALIIFIGLFLAHYISHLIKEEAGTRETKLVTSIVKIVIIFIALMVGLEQIGIQVNLLQQTFLILLASFGFGMALAFGLIFGLGMKKDADKIWEKIKKSL